ncbi:MAG TPA: hypothetical protein VNB06_02355 [Thermoanaerobaculia bacterium]|nr:hypothetical protein [Thermoanaerobaculia bacterium]
MPALALSLRLGPVVAIALLGLPGPAAGADPLQHGFGAEAVVVVTGGETTRVMLGSGRAEVVETDASFVAHDLAVSGGAWMVAGSRRGLDRRERLALLAGDAERQRELPTPPGQTGALRTMPVVFGGDRLLAGQPGGGVAWLEGNSPRVFAVWAAEWTGDGFEQPVVVSPPGAGTQTGLSGAELADGSWLLVWTAFDGSDDEVMWSVHTSEGWSEPLGVAGDSQGPDITPSVAATHDGAILAWSRFDGVQYRLTLAAYRDGAWSGPFLADTPSGLYPGFVRGVATPILSYLEVSETAARRWVVSEIDVAGRRVVASAGVPSRQVERPVIVAVGADGVRFGWQSQAPGRAVTPSSVFRAWEPEPQ